MVVIGTTLAAFAMDRPETWKAWTYHAEEIKASYPAGVQYFAAIQVDARGLDPFLPLLDRLQEIGGDYWTWMLDDRRTQVTTLNRLRHITTGQNLVTDFCCTADCSHLLFMAADCEPPADVLPKMLEMDYPLCAPFIPTYCIRGTPVEGRYPFPVEDAMASAAAIFIAREVFRQVRWRWDRDKGMSDDPCYHHDAKHFLGIPTFVRMDCRAKHYPECIGAVETRHSPEAMRVHR
jgi:hypothetical protein